MKERRPYRVSYRVIQTHHVVVSAASAAEAVREAKAGHTSQHAVHSAAGDTYRAHEVTE